MSESLLNPNAFESFPVIETERLILREFSENDLDEMFLHRTNKEVRKYVAKALDPDKHFTLDIIRSVIKSFEDKTGLSWIIEHKQTANFMGSFGFWNIMLAHGRAEVGYSLNPEYWQQGYMTEVLKACLPFGFKKAGIHSVMACVDPENTGSIKALEKVGFVKEAHHREDWYYRETFYDTAVYGLLERDLRI